MSIFVALLAFAAVMIVFATLVTVVVETFHKLFHRRRRGFQEMMEHFYRGALQARLPAVGDTAEPAPEAEGAEAGEVRFAREIIANPACVSGARWGWLRRAWGIRSLFSSSFENLTTRQFVEQLARTEAGRALGELAEAELKRKLTQLSYEFERYGEAATDYFARRASAISVLAAIVVALAANVDAVRLFADLARDRSLAEKVVAELEIGELEAAWTAARTPVHDGVEPAETTPRDMAAEVMKRIQTESGRLASLGLPIGHDFFPYCRTRVMDDRCRRAAMAETPVSPEAMVCAGPTADPGGAADWLGVPRDGFCAIYRYSAPVVSRIFTTADGLGWLLSALLAGGLIGLGAPFWFDVYRRITAVAAVVTKIREAAAGKPEDVDGGNGQRPEPIRKPNSAVLTADDLLKAFRIAAGDGISGAAPARRRRQI